MQAKGRPAKERDWFDLAPVPMMVFALEDFQITHVNRAAEELYGYSREEFLRMTILDIRDPSDRARIAFLAGQLLEGTSAPVRSQHITRSGAVLDVEVRARIVEMDQRKMKLFSIHDITHLKNREREVTEKFAKIDRIKRQADATFRRAEQLVSAERDLILVVDPQDFEVRWTSSRFLWAVGRGREMVTGAPLGSIFRNPVSPSDEMSEIEALARSAASEGKRKVLDRLPAELSNVAIEDGIETDKWTTIAIPHTDPRSDEKILFILMRPRSDQTAELDDSELVSEVANRMRMESSFNPSASRAVQKEIAQVNQRLRVIRDLLGQADWQMDIETGRVSWSAELFDILGFNMSQHEMSFERYLQLLHKDDREPNRSGFAAFLASGTKHLKFRHRIKLENDATVILTGKAERTQINGRDTLLGVVRNATAEQIALTAARRQQDLARLAGAIANVGGWYLDAETRILEWSDVVGRIHGLPQTRRISLSFAIEMFKPQQRRKIKQKFFRCLTYGKSFDETLEIQPARMPAVTVRIIGTAERDETGKIIGISGAMQDVSILTEQNQKMVHLSERMHETLEAMSDGFISLSSDFRVEYMNRSVESALGWRREELLGKPIWPLLQDLAGEGSEIEFREALAPGGSTSFDFSVPARDKWFRITSHRRKNGYDLFIHDFTEDRQRQRSQLQSQKLEALGQLTGGIAHDFNNLLTVILGNTELLLEELENPRLRKLAEIAATTADRGAQLTSRLLSFSRRQSLTPRVVLAEDVIKGMIPLLTRALGEYVKLEIRLDPDPWPIEIDPSQLEIALLNLALNGRDAMPDGGQIVLAVEKTEIQQQGRRQAGVAISVTDNGRGMDEQTLSRVFEPFFTTKADGRGTGLGLPMVYGFASQSGGEVRIDSAPGKGTTVRLTFPASERREDGYPEDNRNAELPRGQNEHILVVEDEPFLRNFVTAQLRALGYKVSAAANADSAMRHLKRHNSIQLLFTDIILADSRNGRELAEQARALRPGLKVLYTSGYATDVLASTGRLDPDVILLAKPYQRATMAQKVREALAG